MKNLIFLFKGLMAVGYISFLFWVLLAAIRSGKTITIFGLMIVAVFVCSVLVVICHRL